MLAAVALANRRGAPTVWPRYWTDMLGATLARGFRDICTLEVVVVKFHMEFRLAVMVVLGLV